jgi:hypothetical protein
MEKLRKVYKNYSKSFKQPLLTQQEFKRRIMTKSFRKYILKIVTGRARSSGSHM